ncbi:aminotransferase class I/II-fold pyridoxal phosphate-dependent enzyme [Kribbella qitaiheensis]|uniref:Aminotransferase class I/II-fold pyridoxal phosphate-dependent enzyme n=1 Tax=Kribbella qitaiheensis TaxID=1544730 RepID=A0A7G6WWS1_9ACTN|nr:aminotransferase class I/II-fold pyridoxal phosphate-dependent enzyme [Kribbella qitaiheensis]QNE18436.1 aminotransferase class I/II-fold pyridoxal phosphate-dependent enzyme [Kribbella qitaiheensis]
MSVSHRAQQLGRPGPDVYAVMAADPWSADNPDGYIDLGTAENRLVFDLLEPRLTAPRRVTAEDTQYQELAGSLPFRVELARFLTGLQGVEVDAGELVVLAGVGPVLEALAYALCDPGEAIVVPAPYFPGVDGAFGGRAGVRVIPAQPGPDFVLSAEAVDAAITEALDRGERPRAVCLLSPGNPLGLVYDAGTLQALADVAARHNLHLIVDEIYAGSVHDGSFVSASRLKFPADRLHLAWGFAKDFGLSGYKVGVLQTRNPDVRTIAERLGRFATPSSDTQVLLRDLLADTAWTDAFLTESRSRLATAYRRTTEALDAAGLSYLPATAGLFLYLDLRQFLPEPTFEAESTLATRIFTDARLHLPAGATFHTPTPGYYRLCFTTTPAVPTAITRLTHLLTS